MTVPFACRLDEAARWCASKLDTNDPTRSLRSAELVPPGREDWLARVDDVAERRAELVNQGATDTRAPDGRLLVFDPGQSLSDGAAEVETGGLFDEDNTPPWDTWVAYIIEQPQRPDAWTTLDSYLVCWIPAELVDLVDRAIAVNPEGCLLWADEADTPFLRQWFSRMAEL
jgi:hypothetical protein